MSPADIAKQDVARLAIERGLADAYRQVFGVLFWFMVLQGPVGAVLYRAAVLLAGTNGKALSPAPMSVRRSGRFSVFGEPARQLLRWVDWIPVRLTALSFAVVGDFDGRSDASAFYVSDHHLQRSLMAFGKECANGALLKANTSSSSTAWHRVRRKSPTPQRSWYVAE